MATKVDVLTNGYADMFTREPGNKFMRATGSCCLIRTGRTSILFDTMGPWERELLINKLSNLRIHPDDIEYLVCSHSHPDHIGNINLFTKAKRHFIGTSVYSEDVYDLNCFEPTGSYNYKFSDNPEREVVMVTYQEFHLAPNISIQPTQGHTMECVSVLIGNCDTYGSICLAGDLFENENDIDNEGIWLAAGSQDPDRQRANRSRVYNQVDYILPGHGPMFKTTLKPRTF